MALQAESNNKAILITGGAGFIGTNLADYYLTAGKRVILFDNLSRAGVESNLKWLQQKHGSNLQVIISDIRDREAIGKAVEMASCIFHYAAQVAVTSSLHDPISDFAINAQGTLNLLEAVRLSAHQPPIIFASTNKVYGDLYDLGIVEDERRYYPENGTIRQTGISEERKLDFHSPYGCSKGVADQYMLDYARTFGLRTAVFRMSCIYGLHQFGTEDQGWVAHFCIQALKNKPINLYGDGKQVRDILFVDDLVAAYVLAMENIDSIAGNAFNIGGGVNNTISLLELCEMIGSVAGEKPALQFEDWRLSDQKYYVSNYGKFHLATGWVPQTSAEEGVARLFAWLKDNTLLKSRKPARKSTLSGTMG